MQIIGENCSIHPSVTVGHFVVIGRNVTLCEGVTIGSHVVIHDDTVVEANVTIHDGAVLGKLPMRAARSATTTLQSLSPCSIGTGSIIGTYAIVYRGATIGERVLVADLATVRENVTVGDLTIVGRGVAIENKTTIGKRCKLETNAYITAMSTLGDDVFVAPAVVTTNDNFLGRTEERFKHFGGPIVEDNVRIGANAIILPGKRLGQDCLVAAGCIVTAHVGPHEVIRGVPGRVVGAVTENKRS